MATRTRVWRRGRWDWAYEFPNPTGEGTVFGCGFPTREAAQEAKRQAKARRADRPRPTALSRTPPREESR